MPPPLTGALVVGRGAAWVRSTEGPALAGALAAGEVAAGALAVGRGANSSQVPVTSRATTSTALVTRTSRGRRPRGDRSGPATVPAGSPEGGTQPETPPTSGCPRSTDSSGRSKSGWPGLGRPSPFVESMAGPAQ